VIPKVNAQALSSLSKIRTPIISASALAALSSVKTPMLSTAALASVENSLASIRPILQPHATSTLSSIRTPIISASALAALSSVKTPMLSTAALASVENSLASIRPILQSHATSTLLNLNVPSISKQQSATIKLSLEYMSKSINYSGSLAFTALRSQTLGSRTIASDLIGQSLRSRSLVTSDADFLESVRRLNSTLTNKPSAHAAVERAVRAAQELGPFGFNSKSFTNEAIALEKIIDDDPAFASALSNPTQELLSAAHLDDETLLNYGDMLGWWSLLSTHRMSTAGVLLGATVAMVRFAVGAGMGDLGPLTLFDSIATGAAIYVFVSAAESRGRSTTS